MATGRPVRYSFSFLLRAFRVGLSRTPKQGVEQTYARLSFRALGVSAEVARRARAARHHQPVPDPGARPPGRARRPRRAGQGAHRVGQDPRLRPADRRARPRRPTASRPSLVLVPTRELAAQVAGELELDRQAEEACASQPSTAAPRSSSQAKRARGAHILDRHARPPPGSDRAPAGLARPRPDARPRRGRPDARHGLQAPGRPDRPPAARATARRCSSRRRSTARSASSPARTRATRRASRRSCPTDERAGRGRAHLRLGHRTTASSTG